MGMIDINGIPRTSRRNRAYAAIAGRKYSETLPPGYRSAVFTNNSGHYILIRLGGVDAPVDPASAERVIPPFHSAGVTLSGSMVGVGVTDTVASFGADLATGADGICDAVYSTDAIQEFNTPLAGATQATILPPFNRWVRVGRMDDLAAATALLIVDGPITLREAKITPTEEASATGELLLYMALHPGSAVGAGVVLAAAMVSTLAFVPAYLPEARWGPAAAGAELVVPSGWGLYAFCSVTLTGVLLYAEYHT